MKITKPQQKVLAELKERGKLYYYVGPLSYYFLGGGNVNRRTVRALSDRHLIKYVFDNGEPGHYVITPAGEAALAEAEEKCT